MLSIVDSGVDVGVTTGGSLGGERFPHQGPRLLIHQHEG